MNRNALNQLARGVLVACSGWLLSGCAATDQGPTAPIAQGAAVSMSKGPNVSDGLNAGAALVNELTMVRVLGRLIPLKNSITVEAPIGANGGSLSIPSLGITLVVPAGAVNSTAQFKLTALAGKSIAYEFAPHGIKFNVPLHLQQRLGLTTWLPGATMRGGYFKSPAQCDLENRAAKVDEVMPATQSGGTITLDIWHFSGYLVSMA